MKPFELFTAPLAGTALIEAGAGTGKTYTLAGIFLRLIVENGMKIDQILVVTYTKAATEELKTRIRDRLLTAKAAFLGRSIQDEFLSHLVAQIGDRGPALQRVEDALTDFDRSAIFTIHGFCQRLLQNFSFETGHVFQSELVQDQQLLAQEVVDDYWRRHISNAPYELAHFALATLKGPEQLAAVLGYCRYPDVAVRPALVKPPLTAIAPWREAADRLVRLWTSAKEQVINLLLDPGLNARAYGKCEPDPQQPHVTQRHIRLMALSAAMDLWNGEYPLPEQTERFSSSYLAKATKKNCVTPQHRFFDACETAISIHARMVGQMLAYVRYLKIRLHKIAPQKLDDKKTRKNILFFDDLLLHVRDALANDQGARLVKAVNEQYKAALVDEFQDTDPLQYEIFVRLFGRSAIHLLMIGDPKQAIYSFRGADVFSYLKAAESARNSATLTKNWRSTPILVQAVNTIFESRGRPFGFEKIKFHPAVAARPGPACGQQPLTLWYLAGNRENAPAKPINQESAVSAIAAAVAEEILRLISDPGMDIVPAQIAVLTRTHKQSQIIKKALALKKVPAVLHSAGSVFDTSESEDLIRLLGAAAAPNDPAAVRAALCTDLFGVQAHEFYDGLHSPTDQWQARWSAFANDHQTWERSGFYRMFRGLMRREKIQSRILALPEGERRLTNLLHLAELLHQAETDHHLGPEGLIKWMAAQRQSTAGGTDDRQLRLESDALAVRIITMHKSKGLQFEAVFCPFIWGGVSEDQAAAVFHDSSNNDQLTLAMGPDIAPNHRLQARKEALAENLRMLYVALTRARRICYMAWGRISNTEVSAPAYLLHASGDATDSTDWITPLVRKMRSLTDADMLADLQNLARRSAGSIVVQTLPETSDRQFVSREAPVDLSECRTMQHPVKCNWRMASFSSLTSGLPADDIEWPDRDPVASSPSQTDTAGEGFSSLFNFPKGAGAGLFFHDVLEHWNHASQDRKGCRALVAAKLKAHGLDNRWSSAVERMLTDLALTPLKSTHDQFTLFQVPEAQRINEMEFYFPLRAFDVQSLKLLFEERGRPEVNEMFGSRLGRLTFKPMQGYLKGYIDTVFRFGERYYIVDWKSNHLGDSTADYDNAALARTMVAGYYFLQYNLYATALDRFLKLKIAGYDYARHFGGVFYIFLRGIGPDPTQGTGVFYDQPDKRLISGLTELLIKK